MITVVFVPSDFCDFCGKGFLEGMMICFLARYLTLMICLFLQNEGGVYLNAIRLVSAWQLVAVSKTLGLHAVVCRRFFFFVKKLSR